MSMASWCRACLMIVSIGGAWGCASASSSALAKDGGADAAHEADAGHPGPPPPAVDAAPPGPCDRQAVVMSCDLSTSCSEAWSTDGITAIQQGCQGGKIGGGCPGGFIGYCIAPPALAQLGSVSYYYAGSGSADALKTQCLETQGTWCL